MPDTRARLIRLVNRAPEVMVKVTGRTRDPGHLRAHLEYISRNGELELEARDGALVVGRAEVQELASAWAVEQQADRRTRADAPFSHSVVLSMPEGTNPMALRDAVRAFAMDVFAGGHDYVFTLHTDTPRPHVHLSICSRGDCGQRLNPKKADLERWRQVFAEKLRERGVEAEATPRRARGVTRKAERTPLRKMRDRHEAGRGEIAAVRRSAYREAAGAAFQGDTAPRPWEQKISRRQGAIRALYLAQARVLQMSGEGRDRELGRKVEAFVQEMPHPDSQRLALARELRRARTLVGHDDRSLGPERTR
jgi:type IV secretory pathway VirD2 relaxase